MSSTRTRNTPGNYDLEQWAHNHKLEYFTYPHSQYGSATKTFFPGNGLVAGRVASTELSHNACDTESFLFGIGSSNLVNPQSQFVSKVKHLPSLSIFDRQSVILPESFTLEANQRPLR
jgi:hypothetical protein